MIRIIKITENYEASTYFELIVFGFVVAIVKQTGIALLAIVILSFVAMESYKLFSKRKYEKIIIVVVGGGLSGAIGYFSWALCCRLHPGNWQANISDSASINFGNIIGSFFDYLRGRGKEYQYYLITRYPKALFCEGSV